MLQQGISQALAAASGVAALIGTPTSRADSTTGIFPGQLPEATPLPAIAYIEIAGSGVMSMDGPDPLQFSRMSFSCDGGTYGAAKTLARAVRQFLEGFTGPLPDGTQLQSARRVSEIDIFDYAPFTYRTVLDVEIVYQDVTP